MNAAVLMCSDLRIPTTRILVQGLARTTHGLRNVCGPRFPVSGLNFHSPTHVELGGTSASVDPKPTTCSRSRPDCHPSGACKPAVGSPSPPAGSVATFSSIAPPEASISAGRASLPVQTSQSAASSGRSVDRRPRRIPWAGWCLDRIGRPACRGGETSTLPLGARREWHPGRRGPSDVAGRCPPISAIRNDNPVTS